MSSVKTPPSSPFLVLFCHLVFHLSLPLVVTPSSPSSSIFLPLWLFVIRAVTEFTGFSQRPVAVTHSLYNSSPLLTLHSLLLAPVRLHRKRQKTSPHSHILTPVSHLPLCSPSDVRAAGGRLISAPQTQPRHWRRPAFGWAVVLETFNSD